MEPKSLKSANKRIKIDVQKKHVFQHRFFSIFRCFCLRKQLQNRSFFAYFSKTSILCKSLQNTGCAHKNQGSEFKKNEKHHQKIDAKTHSKKTTKKTSPKIDFGFRSGHPKSFKIDPTAKKIEKNDIFQVEVMKNFSFFSIKKIHTALVLKSFENLVMDNRKVSVELTKKSKTFSFTSSQKKKKSIKKRRFK